jgi:hypothetical protein
MVWLKKLKNALITFLYGVWYYITWPYEKVKEELAYRKRLKEIKKQDPFIYK